MVVLLDRGEDFEIKTGEVLTATDDAIIPSLVKIERSL